MLGRVQEQLTRPWERNQALVTHTRDQLAQHEAGLMDLREALNRAVGTTREAEELNSRNQERLEEALVESCPCPSSSPPPPPPHHLLHPPLLPAPSSTPPPPRPLGLITTSPPPLYFPTSPLFCYLPCSPHHLQQRKQELSRDNATLGATLQAARDTLARVSELLRGMDQAREVSTPLPKGCILSGDGHAQIRFG